MNRLAGLVEGSRPPGPGPAAGPDIEAIARAEIERGRQAQQAADKEAQAEGRLRKVETDLAKMRETKPKEPVRRITRLFWPGHDRD